MQIKQALEALGTYVQLKKDLQQAQTTADEIAIKLNEHRAQSGLTDEDVETYGRVLNLPARPVICNHPQSPPTFDEARSNTRDIARKCIWQALKNTEDHSDKWASVRRITEVYADAMRLAQAEPQIPYIHSVLVDDEGLWLQASQDGLWAMLPPNKCFTIKSVLTWMVNHTDGTTALDIGRGMHVHVNHPNRILKRLLAGGYVKAQGATTGSKPLKTHTGVRTIYTPNPSLSILHAAMLNPLTDDLIKALAHLFNPVDMAWLRACEPPESR